MNSQQHQAEVGSLSSFRAGLTTSIVTGQQPNFMSAQETDSDFAEAEVLHLFSTGVGTLAFFLSLFFRAERSLKLQGRIQTLKLISQLFELSFSFRQFAWASRQCESL